MSRTRINCIRAFTKVELLAVLAVIAMAVLMMIPALQRARSKAERISCVSCFKNIGLGFRIFATDNQGFMPFQFSTNSPGTNNPISRPSFGGTREYALDPVSAWRHFAVITNELSTPKILHCRADRERTPARNFLEFTNNRFLSYTVGISVTKEQHPQSILASDRNLMVDGLAVSNTVLTLTTNLNAGWDRRIHVEAGNVLLGDGSVQQVSSGRLSEQFRDAAVANPEPQKLVVP
jgi:type II secretory pathway pseudopilin PulG